MRQIALLGFLALALAGCGRSPPLETAPICFQRGGGIPFGPCTGRTYST